MRTPLPTHRPTRWLVVLVGSLALVAGACGDAVTTNDDGVPTIEIEAQDAPAFSPERLEFEAGETVRFVVHNGGANPHEFVLGDEAAQAAHAQDMGEMDHDGGQLLAALELPPGATRETTVTFDEPGELIYGCHEPGHYEAGMLGVVTVM